MSAMGRKRTFLVSDTLVGNQWVGIHAIWGVNAGRRRQGLSLGQGSVYSFKQLLKAFRGLLTDFW